jgi:hypothetical protein
MSPLMQSRLPMLRVEGDAGDLIEPLIAPLTEARLSGMRAGMRRDDAGSGVTLRMDVLIDTWHRVELSIHPSLLTPEPDRPDDDGVERRERERTLVMLRVLREVVEARTVPMRSLPDMDAVATDDATILDALALEASTGRPCDEPFISASIHAATPLGTGGLGVGVRDTDGPVIDATHRHAAPGVVRVRYSLERMASASSWDVIRIQADGRSFGIIRPDPITRMRMIRDVEERQNARRGDGA